MPGPSSAPHPEFDAGGLSSALGALPAPEGSAYGAIAQSADPTPWVRRAFNRGARFVGMIGQDPFGATVDDLPAEKANEKYGVSGYLRFNEPVSEGEAADRSAAASERQYHDLVLSRAQNVNPLLAFGAGVGGSIFNPVGLPLMFTGEGAVNALKGLASGGEALEGAAAAAQAVSRLGRVGNVALDGARVLGSGVVGNLPYVGVDYAARSLGGDDYDFGDALRDLAAGAVFHTGIHYGGVGLGMSLKRASPFLTERFAGLKRFAGDAEAPAPEATSSPAPAPEFEPEPNAAPEPAEPVSWGSPPDPISDLTPAEREGALVKAVDDVTDDRPADVGRFVEIARSGDPESLGALDERSAQPQISGRWLDEATAVTPRGSDVPVRYGLVELDDLKTSHDDELNRNPAFPPELQPRDRGRAASQAANHELETRLNPKLLMRDVTAAGGAPIVSPDGVVESGNGRTIALRRSARTGSPAYQRYLAELKAQGFETEGMQNPALVRMRTQPLDGAPRAALAREMNTDVVERMSAPEQAMADARGMDDGVLSHLDGTADGDRRFARAFFDRIASPQERNGLVTDEGIPSKAGADRLKAALVARAYGDPRLVEAMFEAADPNIKAIGQALTDAAPAWARMRLAADRGDIPADVDMTPSLRSAVDLVRHARDSRISVSELITERLGQTDMFSGEAISPETEAFLRLMFRDEKFTKPRAADKLAFALKEFARQAEAFQPGPDLFGDVADANTSRQILESLRGDVSGDAPDELELGRVRAGRDGPGGAPRETEPPGLDLSQPRGERGGEPGELRPEGGGGAGASGDGVEDAGASRVAPASGEAFIAADPELRALKDEIDALDALHPGEPGEAPARENPNTIAEAIRAAAVCLIGELG